MKVAWARRDASLTSPSRQELDRIHGRLSISFQANKLRTQLFIQYPDGCYGSEFSVKWSCVCRNVENGTQLNSGSSLHWFFEIKGANPK